MVTRDIRRWLKIVSGMLALSVWLSSNLLVRAEPKESATRDTDSAAHVVSSVFNKLRASLLARTTVPLRLPTFIPGTGDKENPLYANLVEANSQGYSIEIGWVEGCLGGNVCHYGTVRGSTKPLLEEHRVKIAVILSRGVQGYFIDFSCGAHCDDAVVGWSEKGFQYSISVKAGKKEQLINMANSAIDAAQK